jgi:hypothetical protein
MHINPKEEHNVGGDDGSCGSCCSTRVSTLLKDMESGANTLHGFGDLFFWDVRLGKDHGKMSLMIFEVGVMPYLEEESIFVSLMLYGGLSPCVDSRVKT